MPGPELTARGQRVAGAIERVDALLQRNARRYPAALPPYHYARLTGWAPPDRVDGMGNPWAFAGVEAGAFAGTVQRQLEICRAQAEAVLVDEELDGMMLNPDEREQMICRALGVPPTTERDRFGEIYANPALRPNAITRTNTDFLAALDTISTEMSPGTALAYGMLILGGMRAEEQLFRYAERIDKIFARITSAPSVIQALDRAALLIDNTRRGVKSATSQDSGAQAFFGILLAVHEQLWALKPHRASTPFFLAQVIDNYLGPQAGVGNSLGLAVFDAVIVNKLGFEVRYHIESDVIHLEIPIEKRSIYWDVTRPSALSYVPIANGRRLEFRELLAITCGSIAAVYFHQGRIEKAIELYKRQLEITPDSADTLNCLATCYIRQRMPERAAEMANKALGFAPESSPAYYNLGNALALMERWPRAIEALKKAIEIEPDYVEAYNNLGFAFQRSGRHEQAIGAFEAAVERRPEYPQAHFNLGNVYLELERFEPAIACYREAARLQPSMAQAYYNMGQAEYGRGHLDDAITCYRHAVEVNPKHYGAWHNLGIVYRDKGMKAKAVEALEKAVTINPNLMR